MTHGCTDHLCFCFFDSLYGKDRKDIQIHICVLKGGPFGYLLRACDAEHHDGCFRFLCDLEYTLMERQQLTSLASCTLRVDTDGDFLPL